MARDFLRRRLMLAGLIGLVLLVAGLAGARVWSARIAWKSKCDLAAAHAAGRARSRELERQGANGGDGWIDGLRMDARYWTWLRDTYFLEPSPLPNRYDFERRCLRESARTGRPLF